LDSIASTFLKSDKNWKHEVDERVRDRERGGEGEVKGEKVCVFV
jgi:hypothetical protein